ncbi:M20/M25/M40 family metallo-hydrolase [Oscillibacter sp. MSJ-2]|uniref:M20/M25/M40 family metallo-hydrolase n=1 Tax=Dysosmobacter acutus TaxID=2841504 RepID=A0ABS6F5B3_9FIRM|nr:M20/M25/M40 family metallo-hydrolase [Dysosmobacter acutus]MBU5625362.1 M20/M25/M40 family metallo-hydrolase [Dysosmobacter acutus]
MSRKESLLYSEKTLDVSLENLREFVAQPSISCEGKGMRECAGLILRHLKELDCTEAELIETPGYPGVWGYYDAKAAKTLVVYGYFDCNSVGQGWTVEPFGGVVGPRGEFKSVLFGRGVRNKGPILTFINALKKIVAADGTLPVNVMLLIEGEEFLSSRNVPFMLEKYQKRLAAADYGLCTEAGVTPAGVPIITLGNKGFIHLDMKVSGEKWGRGPQGSFVHGSAQCVVDSPVWRLVQALSTLFDPETQEVTVEGFGEGLAQPTEAEDRLIDELLAQFDGRPLQDVLPYISGQPGRVERFVFDLEGKELLKRYLFHPSFNINGLRAGYTGPGTPLFTLPTEAVARFDLRLPRNMTVEQTLSALRGHLDAHGFADIEMDVMGGYGSTSSDLEDDLVQAALRALEDSPVKPLIWPKKSASNPVGVISDKLGIKVLTGFGNGITMGGNAGPDECLVIESGDERPGLRELEASFIDLLYNYAEN